MTLPQACVGAGGFVAVHGAVHGALALWAWRRLAPSRRQELGFALLLAGVWTTTLLSWSALPDVVGGLGLRAAVGLCALAAVAGLSGAWVARALGALPVRPLLWATLGCLDLCASLLWAGHAGFVAHVPADRMLAFAAPTCWLAGTFAASVQVLAHARPRFGHVPLAMNVARRLLLSRGAEVVSTVSRIAVLGVTLGVWLVLVAMGILSGFEHDLTEKIVGAGAHLTLTRTDAQPMHLSEAALQATAPQALAGAAARASFVETELAVASGSNYAGAQLMGVEPDRGPGVLALLGKLTAAQRRALAGPCAPHCPLVLGSELARNLGVGPGDRVRLISPVGEVLTPLGPVPRSMGARVVGVLESKIYEVDSRMVISSVEVARRLLGWPQRCVSGLQLAAQDPEQVEALALRAHAQLASALDLPAEALLPMTWQGRNQTLFAALELERVVAAVVLTFIILVASFSIVNTLSLSILERRHEIAMLKAMGATDATVLQIFLGQGMLIGGIGTAVGAVAGVLTLAALSRWGFGIPYEVYYIDALPVDIAWADVVGVVAAALLILWNFAVVPSSQAAALRPAEGLRDG